MVLFHFILILINVIPIIRSLDACRQKFGTHKYDLNQLNHLILFGDDDLFRYALTPCALIPTENCGKPTLRPFEKGMTACQERITTTNFESSMGFLDGYDKSPNLKFSENPQGPGTGILMSMQNALCNGKPRIVNITFICDETINHPSTMDVKESISCVFAITVKAAGACPIKGSVSGGTIFIIILLVLVLIYLLVGISYNRFKRKETGLAVLPHPTFWLLLVTSFVTGCRFCMNFIRNGCRQTYQPV